MNRRLLLNRQHILVAFVLLLLTTTTEAQERQRWPTPTYTVEIRGAQPDKPDEHFRVVYDGYYVEPSGKKIKMGKWKVATPMHMHIPADCQIHLKIRPNDKPYKIDVFYEFGDKVQRRGGVESRVGEGIVLNIEPYAEDK